jgi:hypothetical protein
VKNYNRIEIEFIKTRFPGEYIQLQYILYGKYIQWTASDIRSAKLTEDIDVTGATVSVNRANVEIVDEDENFNISIPNREWQSDKTGPGFIVFGVKFDLVKDKIIDTGGMA